MSGSKDSGQSRANPPVQFSDSNRQTSAALNAHPYSYMAAIGTPPMQSEEGGLNLGKSEDSLSLHNKPTSIYGLYEAKLNTMNSTSDEQSSSTSKAEDPAEFEHRTFECFNKLPVEVRLKIWNLVLPEPRIVPASFDARGHNFTTTVKPPVLLRVCRESRIEAQRKYPPSFAVDALSSVIPFNFELDTMLLMPVPYTGHNGNQSRRLADEFYKRLPLRDRSKVKSIAVNYEASESMGNIAARFFRNTSTVIVVNRTPAVHHEKGCTCTACTPISLLNATGSGLFLRYENNFNDDAVDLGNWARFRMDLGIGNIRIIWSKNNRNLPDILVRNIRQKCASQDGEFVLIRLDHNGHRGSGGTSRRSERNRVKKDYTEIPEDETEFE